MAPSGALLIEATSDTEYTAVQLLLQVITDSVQIREGYPAKLSEQKPFIAVNYRTLVEPPLP